MKRLLPLLLALLLLAGCQAAPPHPSSSVAPSPSVTPDPSSPVVTPAPEPSVTVHWDVLAEKETPLFSRISDGPLPTLIPSDDYGLLVPYIGGEREVMEPWLDENGEQYTYTSYLYGLCTADGVIVTDPVYSGILTVSWYGDSRMSETSLPLYLLTQPRTDGDGEAYNAVAVCAQDGSWCTDMIFRSSLGPHLAATPAGVLMRLGSDTAVMIGLDGQELFRWTLDDLFSDGTENLRWFFQETLSWCLQCQGDLIYLTGLDSMGTPRCPGTDGNWWFDPYTGEYLDDPALNDTIVEYSSDTPLPFADAGGRFYTADGVTTVTYYDGRPDLTLAAPGDYGPLTEATAKLLIFMKPAGYYTLTDHDLNVLAQGYEGFWFRRDEITRECWPVYYSTDEDSYLILDEQGEILHRTTQYTICAGLLHKADDRWYRLIDLNNNCEDVLRLPRWAALDHPADDES